VRPAQHAAVSAHQVLALALLLLLLLPVKMLDLAG
jgi:hypothetical protein